MRSKFDSCLYLCFNPEGSLEGILGAHVDDSITGGSGPCYQAAVDKLRTRFPFRKWRSGTGEFLGTIYEQHPETKENSFGQKEYAEHIRPIKIDKERAKRPWLPASPQEISALRAVNGALSWLSTQTRPELSVQTSQSQQCFPQPTVFDLLQANQAVRRARQQADLRITVPYIPSRVDSVSGNPRWVDCLSLQTETRGRCSGSFSPGRAIVFRLSHPERLKFSA